MLTSQLIDSAASVSRVTSTIATIPGVSSAVGAASGDVAVLTNGRAIMVTISEVDIPAITSDARHVDQRNP